MSNLKPLLVVAGVGNGSGTGAATARLFAKNGYSVALISRGVTRGSDGLNKVVDEITSAGGEAAPFPIKSYDAAEVTAVFAKIFERFPADTHSLRVALFNVSQGIFKNFLSVTDEDVSATLGGTIAPAFPFSRQVILRFKENEVIDGSRGTLIFTGATASIRGNVKTSIFSVGHHGLRALSQSLAKEFGKENIHVVHSIIDGSILTDWQRTSRNDPEWEKDEDNRLDPHAIALAYQYAVSQHRSAWTWELDLRPAHEKW